MPDLERLGFDIVELSDARGFEVRGLPALMGAQQDAQTLVDALIDQHRDNLSIELNQRERIALSLAKRGAVRRGLALQPEAQLQLVAQLFSTSHPEHTPSGQRCIISYQLDELEREFGRS